MTFSKPVIISCDRALPPYEFINKKGLPDGFNVELIEAIFERLGYAYELRALPWQEVYAQFAAHKVDLVTGLVATPERQKLFLFGDANSISFQTLVFRKDSPCLKTDDLSGSKVIVEEDEYSHHDLLAQGLGANLILVKDMAEGFRLLARGVGDFALCSDEVARYYLNHGHYGNLMCRTFETIPQKNCFASTDPILLEAVNRTFRQLKADGTYDKIYERWFRQKLNPFYLKAIIGCAIILLIVVGLLICLNQLLRRKIRQHTKILEDSIQKIHDAIKTAGLVLWEYDCVQKKYSSYNDMAHLIDAESGYLNENIHPDDRTKYAICKEILSERQDRPFSFEIRFRNSDEECWRYYTLIGSPSKRNEKGQIIRYTVFGKIIRIWCFSIRR